MRKPDNPKTCKYYDKDYKQCWWKDGCAHVHECFTQHCPIAVKRMTAEEKKFYGINRRK